MTVAASGHLYWADMKATGSGSIWRIGVDGQGAMQLVAGLNLPHDLALDEAGGKLYWTENISRMGALTSGAIRSANLGGSGVADVLIGLTERIRGITVDAVGGKLYWTEHQTGEISRADLDGSGVEAILSGLTNPHDVTLDGVGGRLYWTEGFDDSGDPTGKIRRANLDGSSPEDVLVGLNDRIRDLAFATHCNVDLIFKDGFESGDTGAWSSTVPSIDGSRPWDDPSSV